MLKHEVHRDIDYREDRADEPAPLVDPRVLWAVGAGVVVLAVLLISSQLTSLAALNRRAEGLSKALARAQAETLELEMNRDFAATDAGAEESLRELGWLKEGETAIVPQPDGGSTAGRQRFNPDRHGPAPPNWQRWWRWFFGDGSRSPAR